MIVLCAALRIKETGVVVPCCRHGDGFSILHDLGIKIGISQIEQGFINTKNEFLTREEAFEVAMNNGQLSAVTRQHKRDQHEYELYSEDLY